MTASGSVSDFDDAKRTSLESSIAAVAGVDASAVTVAITGGSVLITATIAVPASTTVAAVQTSLSSTLGTAAAASTVLGVIVESVPAITVAGPLPPDAPTRMPRPPAPLVAPQTPPPSARPLPPAAPPSPPPPLPPQPRAVFDAIGGASIETSRDGGGAFTALVACAAGVGFALLAGGLLFLHNRRRRRRPPVHRSVVISGGAAPKGAADIEGSSRRKRRPSSGTVQMAGVCAIEHDVCMASLGEPAGAAGSSSTVCAHAIEVLEVPAGDAGVLEAEVVRATAHKRNAAARLQRWWRRRRRSRTGRLTDLSPSSRGAGSPIVRVHHSHSAIAELSVVPLPLVDATARVVDP